MIKRVSGAAAAALLLAGCTPSLLIPAFDDLTNETVTKGTPFVDYRTFASISGLAPIHGAGMIVHQPDRVSPGHAIAVSPKWSFVAVSEYEVPDGVDPLPDLRESYETFQKLAIEQGSLASRIAAAERGRA